VNITLCDVIEFHINGRECCRYIYPHKALFDATFGGITAVERKKGIDRLAYCSRVDVQVGLHLPLVTELFRAADASLDANKQHKLRLGEQPMATPSWQNEWKSWK
jgi:hypothetical protein